jgi:hypothetical protein
MCHGGIVYARDLDGRTLTLAVSGLLWKDNLVMYDAETGSLWNHMQGEAKQGPLKGKKLHEIPSVLTDWQSWRTQHPDTTVFLAKRTSQAFLRGFYRDLERFVLGIAEGDAAKAWTLSELDKTPVLNEEWAGRPVVVLYDRPSITARLYERTVDDRVLTFERSGDRVVDRETGSVWEPVAGRAVDGPLGGRYLTALPAHLSYWDIWLKYHPNSELQLTK